MSPTEIQAAFRSFFRFIESGGYHRANRFSPINAAEIDLGAALKDFILLSDRLRAEVAWEVQTSEQTDALWVFAFRSAAFAVQSNDESYVRVAQCSLVVDRDVADSREIISALVVIHDAASRFRRSPSIAAFKEVLHAATPARRAMIESFYGDSFYESKALKRYGVQLAAVGDRLWYQLGLE